MRWLSALLVLWNLLITEGFPSQTASNSPLWCFLCYWLVHNFKQTVKMPRKIMWRHCNVSEAWISCILPKLHLSGNKSPTLGTLVTYHQIISWLWFVYTNKKSSFNIFATWIRSVIYARFICYGEMIHVQTPPNLLGFLWHTGITVTWWRNQMETVSKLLALLEGIHVGLTDGCPPKMTFSAGFVIFFGVSLKKRLNKQTKRRWFGTPSCSPWCHCNGCDNSFMASQIICIEIMYKVSITVCSVQYQRLWAYRSPRYWLFVRELTGDR